MRHEAKMNASQNYGLPSSLVYRVSSMTENWVSSRDDFHPGAIEAPWDRTPRLSSKSQPRWTFFNIARTVLVSAIVFAGWLRLRIQPANPNHSRRPDPCKPQIQA
jgi:hypothetical protein